MDWGNALVLAEDAFGYGLTISDVSALYGAYSASKSNGGKIDFAGLAKSGTLARLLNAAAKIAADPQKESHLVTLLSGL